MHFRTLLRKSQLAPCRSFILAQRLNFRPIFSESNNRSSPLIASNEDSGYRSRSGTILRSISSAAVALGSTLGFLYWSSRSDSSLFLSYADSKLEIPESDKKPLYLFGDAYRRKVFFKYEKRIRTQSPPEKVFEYFASYKSPNGELFMTPTDLMRAVVPVFPPSEANRVRQGYLSGESAPTKLHCAPSEFFMLFDTNNDGVISFAEYIFFVTLLSIPESSFSIAFKMFDLDNNGEIDREEFKKVMALMRTQHRQGTRHRDGLRFGLKVSGSVENGGLLEYFFGKDGKSCLQHAKFDKFLRDLHNEILRLEFTHYDYHSQGTISAKDFALSMVASADMGHINKFLDRVEELNNTEVLRDVRITYEEFKTFAELRKRLRPLTLAIFSHGKVNGLLTKKDFQRAAYHVCGISLTDNVVDLIYYVFDSNRDGSLSANEFLRVLQKREGDISQQKEGGFMGLISCWLNCTRQNCSSKILVS